MNDADDIYGIRAARIVITRCSIPSMKRWYWQIWCFNYYDSGFSSTYLTSLSLGLISIWLLHTRRFMLLKLQNLYLKLQRRWHVLDNIERLVRW